MERVTSKDPGSRELTVAALNTKAQVDIIVYAFRGALMRGS